MADALVQQDFLRRLVHDLRGPVRALEDIPGWLSEDMETAALALPDSATRLLPLLMSNAARLDSVLAGLADWVLAGDAPHCGAPADDPQALLAALPSAAPCRLTLSVDRVPLAAADLAILGREVFENAARFHPGPRPHVTVTGRVRAGGWVLLFEDDGVGPPGPQPSEFLEPLARAPVGERAAGPGFGLAVVSRIIARYGGSARFGKGAGGAGAVLRLSGQDRGGGPT